MLEALGQQPVVGTLCRFANMRRRLDALQALGIAADDMDEILAFLGGDGDAEELLDAPLRHDPAYTPAATRFSDGSWRVFYAAFDWPTAEAEVGYHVRQAVAVAIGPLYYQRIECRLTGNGYDLRPQAAIWTFLTNPHEIEAYPPCQTLAREARDRGADGLVTTSARMATGTNVPVFVRRALSEPRIIGSAAITASADAYRVEYR